MIEINALRKEWGRTVAVSDVTFTIPKGAVLALVGPNGAGKTTLMTMIAGLTEPTLGSVTIDGLDVLKEPREAHTRVGFLPDFFGLYEELTVRQYMEYFARAYGIPMSEQKTRIETLVASVGLAAKIEAPIEALSRGMRQRVGIARTLISDPPCLLLDEPASGLDPEARHDLQTLIKTLALQGKTLVVSSHILSELEDYCSHVAMLQKGALVAFGTIKEMHKIAERGRSVKIQVNGLADTAVRVVLGNSHVTQASGEGSLIRASFNGDDAALADLLRTLITEGVPVTYFGEEHGRIQESYLAMMKGTSE